MDLEKKTRNYVLNWKGVFYGLLTALVLVLLYWPTLRWLVNSWLSSDYYSHGFLVLLVSVVISWTKRDKLKIRRPSLSEISCILVAAVLYALNLIWEIKVLGLFSLLSMIIGLLWFFYGIQGVRALAFPLAFLLFLVPFPFIPDLAFRLQAVSIISSAGLLDLTGLPITTSGAEIQLQNMVFSVGIPCSGINSIVALPALAAVYAYILKGSLKKRTILFVLAFPIAIIANILRIVSIILVAYFVNIQAAVGWYHDLSSPLFFLLSFLIIILFGWRMKCKINYRLLERQ
jgi:exosortase